MIALLHTSKILIERFETLVRKYNNNVSIKHYVNEKLLDTALLNGKTDTVAFIKQIDEIKKESPSLLICTCSTYGKECDKLDNIDRIDKPIVEYLVANYNKIGLVYTANSTKTVSTDLIYKVASDQNKKIEVVNCDCSKYWSFFQKKDFDQYEKKIAENIKFMESDVDVIFLAQASMEGVKKHLSSIDKKVFSSPEFGIKTLLKQNL